MRNYITAALLVPLFAASALAQDGTTTTVEVVVDDYRWALYTACSVVFVAIAVYLVMTHRSGAKLGEDISHLEGRIDQLEK
jgi:hypothetical protein